MTAAPSRTLRVALGDYPHTAPLKTGKIKADGLGFEFADVKPISRAFGPLVRERKFDLSEIAIVTFLQAKAYGKPLVSLPATMMGRFQHHCLVYNSERGRLTPQDLPGKRIAVRAYSQTTGMWVRGILQNDYDIDMERVHWVTFEDAHVTEYQDPAGVERAGAGRDMTTMLLAGEVDAAIYGADMPKDARLKSVIATPDRDAAAWYARSGIVPVNHLVCVDAALADSDPAAVRAVCTALHQAKAVAGLPKENAVDTVPFGLAALRSALDLAIQFSMQQRLLPRKLAVEELFDGTTLHLFSGSTR